MDITNVKIGEREKNAKRSHVVVNELQCKHIPSSPLKALDTFKELAKLMDEKYKDERVLCVGFAETATAIGFEVARYHGWDYLPTTREVFNEDFIYFEESHSHATEQKLLRVDFSKYDRVVFVEDEVTTGNTIRHIIDLLEKENHKLKFAIASILNDMTSEIIEKFEKSGINIYYLLSINPYHLHDDVDSYIVDGDYISCKAHTCSHKVHDRKNVLQEVRLGVDPNSYNGNFVSLMASTLLRLKTLSKEDKILVIGTEEFMYPAIRLGAKLEKYGYNVKCHSTTRSPICTSKTESNYPLHTRYQLPSCYDSERVTYIYDLDAYDKVLILTDGTDMVGISSLCLALELAGNTNISIYQFK